MKRLLHIFLCLSSLLSKAQTYYDEDRASINVNLSELSLLTIMPDKSAVIIAISSPSKAGNLPTVSMSNNNKWINYTNALSSFDKSRRILVQVTYGTIPQGMKIYLEAASFSGSGKGTMGQPQGKVLLSAQSVLLINNIKGAYTGRGAFNGHKLTYSVEIADPSQIINIGENELQVTYTIADQ